MGYGIAWLLGVPVSILVIWFVVSHILQGKYTFRITDAA